MVFNVTLIDASTSYFPTPDITAVVKGAI